MLATIDTLFTASSHFAWSKEGMCVENVMVNGGGMGDMLMPLLFNWDKKTVLILSVAGRDSQGDADVVARLETKLMKVCGAVVGVQPKKTTFYMPAATQQAANKYAKTLGVKGLGELDVRDAENAQLMSRSKLYNTTCLLSDS
eukprot:TRINITY_DN12330_c1_g4_i6.p1 TRINITY_DN12330_c1_g4~~TRINITY_DN12330_c1_g4_i6.p1  ORF type:complete len:143 (+),score=9.53 TRINITY_DN12330_c1_g4_i6:201-629(+)